MQLIASVKDRGFKPRSGRMKDYKISIGCFSDKHTALIRGETIKTGWLEIRIMNPKSISNILLNQLHIYSTEIQRDYTSGTAYVSVYINEESEYFW